MWWSFLKAVRSGEHRVAPMTWVAAAGALLYGLWPVDLIPELVLGPLGLVDDAGVWGILLVLVTREKQRYEARVRDEAINVAGAVR